MENEQAQQRLNASIHSFTSMCWDKCVTALLPPPSPSDSSFPYVGASLAPRVTAFRDQSRPASPTASNASSTLAFT